MRDDTADGGFSQALEHKKTFKNHEFKAESKWFDELGYMYAEQEAAFAGERMAAVKAAAQDAHAAFSVLEG